MCFEMSNAHPITTHVEANMFLSTYKGQKVDETKNYVSLSVSAKYDCNTLRREYHGIASFVGRH